MTSQGDDITLAQKRKEWNACLSGDDPNSIRNQLHQIVWNAASFRVVCEARDNVPKTSRGDPEISGLLHHLLDCCFWDSQLLATRRLADTGSLAGKLGVCSFISLVDDMQQHADLLKRKDMLAEEGLEYDAQSVEQRHDEYCLTKAGSNNDIAAFFVPPGYDYDTIMQRHIEIDDLASVSAADRSPNDMVRREVFRKIKEKIKGACGKIRIYANKFLAHAATRESRADNGAGVIDVQLNDLWKAHEVLCRAANFLSDYVLNTGGHVSYLPITSFDILTYIDRPLVAPGNVDALRTMWRHYEEETRTWDSWTVAELFGPDSAGQGKRPLP